MAEEQRKTILVVDDTEANMDVLVEILDPLYDISVAMDGESALEIAESEHPDLVLLDIMMPGMDGYEVLKRLRANDQTKDIPVVFVSAHSGIDRSLEGADAASVAFITKPVDPEAVIAITLKYIDQ
jgi:putative two-component system response regulator